VLGLAFAAMELRIATVAALQAFKANVSDIVPGRFANATFTAAFSTNCFLAELTISMLLF